MALHIKIDSEKELVDAFKELVHLAVNARHWQKQWAEHYGTPNRLAKIKWEGRLDDLLDNLEVKYGKGNRLEDITVESKDDKKPGLIAG